MREILSGCAVRAAIQQDGAAPAPPAEPDLEAVAKETCAYLGRLQATILEAQARCDIDCLNYRTRYPLEQSLVLEHERKALLRRECALVQREADILTAMVTRVIMLAPMPPLVVTP